MIKKPMLSASLEDSKGNSVSLHDLKYPLLASLKLDGIRALRINGSTLSRSFKPIPNLYIQSMMACLPDGLDGELIVVNQEFSGTSSGVMSRDGEPNFEFHIFDYVKDDLTKPFLKRLADLETLYVNGLPSFCKILSHVYIKNSQELIEYEDKAVSAGHEGIMLRRLDSPYKCGRSSFKEGFLIKVKRFEDSEAEILDFEERLNNENHATLDELGHTKRSSHKDGLIPANTLGTIIVRDIHTGIKFGIGTGKGLDDSLRKHIWDNKQTFLGKLVKYRYQKVGSKVDSASGQLMPRIPSFQGFRDKSDL